MEPITTPHWSDVVTAKVAARDALIPKEWGIPSTEAMNVIDAPRRCGILTPAEVAITETEAPELIAKMLHRELKSYEVTLAFCKRATIAHQLVNCLTEILFEQGLATAYAIDDEYAKTGKSCGPLHGLPVSMKDNFNIEGVDSTIGFVGWSNKPTPKDGESEMTKVMRECGAILFCKR